MKSKIWLIKNQTTLIHVAVWASIFLLPYLFTSAYYDNGGHEFHANTNSTPFLYLDTLTKILWVGLFYLNTALLVPRLIYKGKYFFYLLAEAVFFGLILIIHSLFFKLEIPGRPFNLTLFFEHHLVTFLFTTIAGIAYKTISDRAKSQRETAERARENLKAELSFLRSQISPHFLFNIMNNIAAMVRLKSDELEPTVHKLSSLMRYMLYETDEEKVLLETEIENLESYIYLQQQRFGEKLKLRVSLNVEEDWHSIEPMLLIPFVENAFKHGTGSVANPEIEIATNAANNKLCFTVKNRFVNTEAVKDKTSGIGLANVKRRLELLYHKQHHLTINKTEGWFTVTLELNFKS